MVEGAHRAIVMPVLRATVCSGGESRVFRDEPRGETMCLCVVVVAGRAMSTPMRVGCYARVPCACAASGRRMTWQRGLEPLFGVLFVLGRRGARAGSVNYCLMKHDGISCIFCLVKCRKNELCQTRNCPLPTLVFAKEQSTVLTTLVFAQNRKRYVLRSGGTTFSTVVLVGARFHIPDRYRS